jgi:cation transport ATPase
VYRRRFWITLILAVPVVVYSEMIQYWFGFTAPQFPGDGLVGPVLGTVIFFYGGSVFLTGAWSEPRQRAPGMMLLVSLAISVAFIASAASALGLFDLEFWWKLSALVVIMLLGHWQRPGAARGPQRRKHTLHRGRRSRGVLARRHSCARRLGERCRPARGVSGRVGGTVAYWTRSMAGSGCSPRYSTHAVLTHG